VIEVLRDGIAHRCAKVAAKLGKGETRRISCTRGAIGNIAKIRMTGTNTKGLILTLCEVEVYGIRGKIARRKYLYYKTMLLMSFPYVFNDEIK